MSGDAEVGEGAALYVLARELWVVSDRLRTLESVLARRGLTVTDEIEAYVPSAEEQARRDAECRRLLATLTGTLAGQPVEPPRR